MISVFSPRILTAALLSLALPALALAQTAPAPSPAPSASAPAAAPFHSTHFIVTTQGTGPDVILIPGLGCSRDVWKDEAARLAPHYRLHFIQVRGFAGFPAGANATGPLLQPIVADLALYIESQQLQKPAIIGHSMGGLLGLMLVDKHPQDVGKLMIVDSLPFLVALYNPKANMQDATQMASSMRTELVEESTDKFLHVENQVIAGMVKTESKRPEVIFWTVNSDRHTLTNAMYEDMTTDMRPELAKIEVPIVLLYPYDKDKQNLADTDKTYREAYATAPHATLVRIDDSAHFIMLDQPQKFDDQVQKFLKN
jgi:pimeloyl-ACP methyl ester carboxylesterase